MKLGKIWDYPTSVPTIRSTNTKRIQGKGKGIVGCKGENTVFCIVGSMEVQGQHQKTPSKNDPIYKKPQTTDADPYILPITTTPSSNPF